MGVLDSCICDVIMVINKKNSEALMIIHMILLHFIFSTHSFSKI